jgi:hypothetical protein
MNSRRRILSGADRGPYPGAGCKGTGCKPLWGRPTMPHQPGRRALRVSSARCRPCFFLAYATHYARRSRR